MKRLHHPVALAALLTAAAPLLASCGGMGFAEDASAGVGQGGAQDFGHFKQILEDGGIPGPETIDDLGFFGEHKIELPPPDCGENVCLHGGLASMANMISGSNCTMLLMGMNTPIDPADVERPPIHLALAVDTSGSMGGEPIDYVRDGLLQMLERLAPGDRVSIIEFDNDARVVAEHLDRDDPDLRDVILRLRADGSTNIYDGLQTAYDVLDAHAQGEWQSRAILLSDGVPTQGVLGTDSILSMSRTHNEGGLALSTIGVGVEFDPQLMRGLAEGGAGAFYFVEDPAAVQEVFVEEAQAFVVPLARRARIDVFVEEGYEIRGLYGAQEATFAVEAAHVTMPILQIAHRTSDDDNANGRRGGGGAMVVEVMPRRGATPGPGPVGTLAFSYEDPIAGETVSQQVPIAAPFAADAVPTSGHFSNAASEKSFVMLNLYVAFQLAAEAALERDDAEALSVLTSIRTRVEEWLDANDDADITDDLRYVQLFIDNLEARSRDARVDEFPPEPWPED